MPRDFSGETSLSHSSGVLVIAAIVFPGAGIVTSSVLRPSYNAGVKVGARTQAVRFASVVAAIGVITAVDFRLLLNHTTVALMFLVTVLLTSAYWGLRYAV